MNPYRFAMISLLVLCMTPLLRVAKADVITYENGRQLKGITQPLPQEPDYILFTSYLGTAKILKSRIQSIQEEPAAQGHIHIGRQYRQQSNFEEALKSFIKALELDPDNAEARQLRDQVQAEIAQQEQMKREHAIDQIDQLTAQARQLIENNKFQQAEDLLKQADNLVPTDPQKDHLASLISELYWKWALEHEDKMDKTGAEEKLNLALAADPENVKVIDRLLQLWEDDPTKKEQSANVYETILNRHPERDELRKTLANLYFDLGRLEDATHHYLLLYQENPDRYQDTAMEEKLLRALDQLHRKEARQKHYDQAIYYFKLLSTIDPATDPTAVLYYQFLQRAQDVEPDDWEGKLELAAFAEENHLDQRAIQLYTDLVEHEPTREEALQGLKRFARQDLQQAQDLFQNGDFALARTLANEVRRKFGQFSNMDPILEEASRLIGHANARIEQQRMANQEQARELARRGDEFYNKAWFHMENIFSTERRDMPNLVSHRLEAVKYFRLAIQAYEQALRIRPSLRNDSTSLVNVRLQESRQRLQALTAPLPPSRNFNRPIISPQRGAGGTTNGG